MSIIIYDFYFSEIKQKKEVKKRNIIIESILNKKIKYEEVFI